MKRIENFGIGADIEGIDRFRELNLVDNKSFLDRVFTKKELDYCFSKQEPAPHLAVRYTGKEAIIKALSSIGKENLSHKEIEILNNEKGLPLVRLNDRDFNRLQISLSLSHCEDKAIAFAAVKEIKHYEETEAMQLTSPLLLQIHQLFAKNWRMLVLTSLKLGTELGCVPHRVVRRWRLKRMRHTYEQLRMF
jgi:holo-[acyl-carrier protein] synthase